MREITKAEYIVKEDDTIYLVEFSWAWRPLPWFDEKSLTAVKTFLLPGIFDMHDFKLIIEKHKWYKDQIGESDD